MKKVYTSLFLLCSITLGFAQVEGTWRVSPEAAALGVGPALGDISWWSNTADDVDTRACFFDDEYVFNADGSFNNVLGDETWNEPWQGMDPEGCGAPIAPHDGSASATWTYDEMAGTITIDGTGAFLGLPKVHNDGELGAPGDAVASITYPVVIDGNTMTIDIAFGTTGYWHFVLVKDGPSASPIEGSWSVAPEAQALAVGPTMGDFSWWSNTADDVDTRACFFDDEYVFNEDGSFNNVLGDETWNEEWQGMDPAGCGAPIAPHDGSASATWTYDEGAGTITIDGTGAFLGLPKVHNDGELGSPGDAVASITYPVVIDGDRMTIDIDFGGTGFWHFVLVKNAPTSVNEVVVNDMFRFFPNPASSQIQIQSEEQMDEIIIRDITGKVVMVKADPLMNETINLASFPRGLYILQSRAGNRISVQKLSIQ